MSLEALGSHWLHPDRTLYGRKSCSTELLYLNDAPAGFDFAAAKARVEMVRAKGADVWLRVDWRPHNVLPQMFDDAGAFQYCQGIQQAVAEMDVRGVICGNEVNLHDETRDGEIQAWWVGRIVYGHTLPPDRTDCVYQFAKTARPGVQILAPAVAPWAAGSSAASGDTHGLRPPDGRPAVQSWESYQYDLARSCYDHQGHAPSISDIQFAIHTYGRVGTDGTANGGDREPWTDVRDWAHSYGAQFGSRWFQDANYYCRQGMLNSPYGVDYYPPVVVSEANTLTDAQPEKNYPLGWWKELTYYIRQFPNVMGLCAFVDQDYGDGWGRTAMTVPFGRLPLWNRDHDELLRLGW